MGALVIQSITKSAQKNHEDKMDKMEGVEGHPCSPSREAVASNHIDCALSRRQ